MLNRLYFIICLTILTSYTAHAQEDQTIVDGGIGVFNSAKKSLSETKTFSLGVQEDLWGPLKQRATGGFWLDNSGNGKKDSLFAAGQLGFEVNNNGWLLGIFSGPALISSPDVLLGGPVQFMDDIHLGIQDKGSNYIGFFYRHFSSAGLEMPNIGRDMIGIELRF